MAEDGVVIFVWVVFVVTVSVASVIDQCFISYRTPGPVVGGGKVHATAAYGRQISFWLIVGAFFNVFLWISLGTSAAGNWFYGYVLEYLLSFDNLFVFQLVFKAYSTPPLQVDRALFYGIGAAVILRLVFFDVGTEVMTLGVWADVFFGSALVYSGVKTLRNSDDEESDPRENILVQSLAKLLPVHDRYSSEPQFFVRIPKTARIPTWTCPEAGAVGRVDKTVVVEQDSDSGRPGDWKVTPLMLVVITLGIVDVIFAVDSVTAKLSSITDFSPRLNFFLNLTSSAMAMFVLRGLYTLVDALVKMFRFLNYGVGVVLILIGLKVSASQWFQVGQFMSCATILLVLLFSIIVSAISPDSEEAPEASAPNGISLVEQNSAWQPLDAK